jgi:hypothetical protein
MSLDPDTIDLILDKANPAALEHWNQIARDTMMHTVALFAISSSASGDVLTLGGTGTLVTDGPAHYILTAAHVWHKALKRADKLGVTLRETLDHRCLIDVGKLVPLGPERPSSWNEWGPDIIFLRIPEARVGEIKAFRVFYGLHLVEQSTYKGEHTQTYLLAGTPHALGTFTQNHASVQIMGFWVGLPTLYEHGSWDYFEMKATIPPPSDAGSFGGVSGGGLWKVQIYGDPSSDAISSKAFLEGVAFYEFDVVEGSGTIRCHGPATIRMVVQNLIQKSE